MFGEGYQSAKTCAAAYALFALMLFPFRNTSVKKLIILGCLLLGLGTLWNISDYQNDLRLQQDGVEAQTLKEQGITLTEAQETSLKDWEKFKTKESPKEVQEIMNEMHQGYWDVLLAKVKMNQFMQTWFPYRIWFWDILSYMLLGMAFYHQFSLFWSLDCLGDHLGGQRYSLVVEHSDGPTSKR